MVSGQYRAMYHAGLFLASPSQGRPPVRTVVVGVREGVAAVRGEGADTENKHNTGNSRPTGTGPGGGGVHGPLDSIRPAPDVEAAVRLALARRGRGVFSCELNRLPAQAPGRHPPWWRPAGPAGSRRGHHWAGTRMSTAMPAIRRPAPPGWRTRRR
jgi:hypothetical protein